MAKTNDSAHPISRFTGHPDFPHNLVKGQALSIGPAVGVVVGVQGGRFVSLAVDGTVKKFLAAKVRELHPPEPGGSVGAASSRGVIVAVTGHVDIEGVFRRPAPEAGAAYDPEVLGRVAEELSLYLDTVLCPRARAEPASLTIVTGMARGVDEVAAHYAMERGLPLVCAVPNSVRWHRSRPASGGIRVQAIEYGRILAYERARVVEVKKDYAGGSFPYANFARNQAMVDLADQVVSWKRRDSAGTDDCIGRARDAGKYFGNVKSLGPLDEEAA